MYINVYCRRSKPSIMSKRRLDIDGGATKKPREDEGGLMPGKKMNPHTGEVKLSAD